MLTIFTSAFARPDYVQLLADSLRATVQERYRFVVIAQPGGLRREWSGVDEVRDGSTVGYAAFADALPLVSGPSVILHDDCVPVLPWGRESFPSPNCKRLDGTTLRFQSSADVQAVPMMRATRILSPADCPASWPSCLCAAAAAARAESLLGGVFLHLDKGTIAAPDCPANETKPRLVEAIAGHLGIAVPEPLTAEERAAHPGRQFPAGVDGSQRRRPAPGLGDMVEAGLTAIGITKERVQAVASAVGIKDCGCSKRREALNRAGRQLGIGG